VEMVFLFELSLLLGHFDHGTISSALDYHQSKDHISSYAQNHRLDWMSNFHRVHL